MSQMQSEVRPQVLRMPKTGFSLQTGGSARRRIIKPFTKQASTNQFPIENKYRVSGVPGHTHNSSAVLSVLVDLKQSRNFTAALTDAWTHTGVNFAAADPGDSAVVEDEHARFDRAIERAVGDICLRPENCHQEIREPVRSISEVRTLVAPDDRLQTMTYVEEVGGFVNQDTSQFVSDFPDVLVDFLGPHDLNLAARTGGAATALTAAAAATPLLLLGDGEATHNIVVLRPADGSSVGFVDGPTDWNGIVPFRWDSAKMVYRAEPFVVTLRRVVQVLKVDPYTNVAEQTLRIRFDAVETTRAEHGNCFIMAEGINKIPKQSAVPQPPMQPPLFQN